MRPDKLSVHDLFQKERRYVVPLYQRSYVWTQEDQWEPLWEDIERQAVACLESSNGTPQRSHFLGAIVLNVLRIVGNSVARSEIIDGQQRLTTLQLYLAALRDYSVECGSDHAGKLTRLTVNEDAKRGSEASFKVWPTNADRESFRSVLAVEASASLPKYSDVKDVSKLPRIAAAYLYFYKVIKEYVETGIQPNDSAEKNRRLSGLLQAMRTGLQVVVIELEEGDDPQIIFETLNARGQPLLPSDLIRNFVFMQAASDEYSDTDDLYNRFWRPFDDRRLPQIVEGESRFWHILERQGRLTRPRIDLFMFHYLVLKTERDLNIGELYREFKQWRDTLSSNKTGHNEIDAAGSRDSESMEEFLSDLKAYSETFADIIAPVGGERAHIFSRRLRSLDISTIYPLLMYILSLTKEQLPNADRDQILSDLESWLIRRMVCQLTNKNYNKFFVQLLVKAKNVENIATLSTVIRNELLRSTDPTGNWPDDEEFLRGWLNNPIYVKSRPDRSVMILSAIERRIRNETIKSEAVTLPGNLTVEHLLPQKGKLVDYPYADPMPTREDETADRCRSRIIHTAGNLTLLTRELNSAVSNGPFQDKCRKIAADSDLRLNAWLRGASVTAWSEADVEKRARELMEYAVVEWAFPGR